MPATPLPIAQAIEKLGAPPPAAPAMRSIERIAAPSPSDPITCLDRFYSPGGSQHLRSTDPITQLDTNTAIKPPSAARESIAVERFVPRQPRNKNAQEPESVAQECLGTALAPTGLAPRIWTPLCYCWEAPALCYGPLYFEENNLERYGYSQTYLRSLQPLASSAQFFTTSFMLPYLLFAEPPCECVYTLGEYRPGSCVPFQWNYPYFDPTLPWQKCDP
jgi:hypothetical protein